MSLETLPPASNCPECGTKLIIWSEKHGWMCHKCGWVEYKGEDLPILKFEGKK